MRLFGNRLRAIRDAVGEDVDIIFESHSLMGAASAIQMGQNCRRSWLYDVRRAG